MKKKIIKNKHGITLIALVVTIVILLILAGVSINLLLGDNGIISKAKEAKNKTNEQSIKEEVEMVLAEWSIDKYTQDSELDIEKFLREKINVRKVNTIGNEQSFDYKGYKFTIKKDSNEIIKIEKSVNDLYAKSNGQLYVDGAYLNNQYGQDIQLKGINIWAYDDEKFNQEFFKDLKDKYQVNCVRLALNSLNPDTEEVDDNGRIFGYLYNIIDSIIANDMYAILDWHLINSGNYTNNPYDYEDSAIKVFTTFATYYKDVPNLMYELANEPKGSWDELLPYYNKLIPEIRSINPNSIIFVTSSGHGLDVEAILETPIEYKNIMYTMHFYYSTYATEEIKAISNAILRGVPIFASEWSPTNGKDSTIQLEYASALCNFMNNNNISSTFWMFTDNNTEYTKMNEITKYAMDYINDKYTENGYKRYEYSVADYTMQERGNVAENTKIYANDSIWHTEKYRDNIYEIEFCDYINLRAQAVEIRDISSTGQGSLLAYIVENNEKKGTYKLYITGNKTIYFPKKSNKLFAFMKNVEKIKNIGNISTELVEDFSSTFSYMNILQEIDVTNFDTSKTKILLGMFSGDGSLKKIDFSKWNTKNVSTMFGMLSGCNSLEKIDLSLLDTTSLLNICNLFQSNKVKDIDISSFDFKTIKEYSSLFVFAENESRTIYVKDEYARDIVKELSPKATIVIR